MVILPETDTGAAESLFTVLLETIARDGVVVDERRAVQVSASIGIATIESGVCCAPPPS